MEEVRLRPYQDRAILSLLRRGRGIVQAPCGAGKTIIGAAAVRKALSEIQARNAWGAPSTVWWLANTQEQVVQARQALELCCGDRIWSFHTAAVTCAAGPCPFANPGMVDILAVDECHHAAAPSWAAHIRSCRSAQYIFGLSATPERGDDLTQAVFDLIGPVVERIGHDELRAAGHLSTARAWMVDLGPQPDVMGAVKHASDGDGPADLYDADDWRKRRHWNALSRHGIEQNDVRNTIVVEGARNHIAWGDAVLILVRTVRHGEGLAGKIGLESEVIHSGIAKRRRAALIEGFRDGTVPCLIATSLADEGLDVPRANVLILAAAGRSARQTEQRAGRVLRAVQGKDGATVYDFVDTWHPWLTGQAKARRTVYEKLGFVVRDHADRRHVREAETCAV